jgi:hypothetical protein
VACDYCKKEQLHKRKIHAGIFRRYQKLADNLQNKTTNFVQALLHPFAAVLLWLLPTVFLNNFKTWSDSVISASHQLLKKAKPYQGKMAYIGFLGGVTALTIAHCFGVGMLADIYVFLAASTWSGKVLNFIANLIVLRQESKEWKWLRTGLKKQRVPLLKQLTRFALELTLIHSLSRMSDFIIYSTTGLFTWLAIYFVYKLAANNSQPVILNLEQRMAERRRKRMPASKILNATWLASYHLYKASCSTKVLKRYHNEHAKHHHPYAFRHRAAIMA